MSCMGKCVNNGKFCVQVIHLGIIWSCPWEYIVEMGSQSFRRLYVNKFYTIYHVQ